MSAVCDVVLVVPGNNSDRLDNSSNPVFERLGVAYLANTLRSNDFSVEIINVPLHGYSDEELVEVVCEIRPKILGYSMMFSQTELPGIINTAPKIKAKINDIHICIGGSAASLTDKNLLESFSFIDSVAKGEGEYILLELTKCISKGSEWRNTPGISYRTGDEIVRNPGAKRITDLDALPFPDRGFIETKRSRSKGRKGILDDIAVMVSSRGCYGDCNFCCVRTFYKKEDQTAKLWQSRSVEDIIDEIEILVKEKGIRHIVFLDDNFIGPGTGGKKRAYKFAQKLNEKNLGVSFEISCRSNDVEKDVFLSLKQAGLNGVFLGVESGVQRSLDFFNKKIKVEHNLRAISILKEIGIRFLSGFIMFDPYTTPNEVLENIRFIKENKITNEFMMVFNVLQAHPNTPLEADLRRRGFDLKPIVQPGTTYIHKYDYSFIDTWTELVVKIVREFAGEMRKRTNTVRQLLATSARPDKISDADEFFINAKKFMDGVFGYSIEFIESICLHLIGSESGLKYGSSKSDSRDEGLKKQAFLETENELMSRLKTYIKEIDYEIFNGKTFSKALEEIIDSGDDINVIPTPP